MEGTTTNQKQYGMKHCRRWDNDGTSYSLTFGELKKEPVRLLQRIRMTQEGAISFGRIFGRLEQILPMAERWLEIWERSNGVQPSNWQTHPVYEIRLGLTTAVITLIFSQDTSRSGNEKPKLIIGT